MTSLITTTSRLLQRTYVPATTAANFNGRAYTNQTKNMTIKFDNDTIYAGEIKDGKPHGKGKLVSPRSMEEGSFFEGKKDGWIKITYSDLTKELTYFRKGVYV